MRILLVVALCSGLAAAPAMAQTQLSGVTDYVHLVDLHARVAGVVDRVLVKEGDDVAADQVLIELENSVQQARLAVADAVADAEGLRAKARAEVQLASSRLARIKRAASRGGAPKWEVREAQHALTIARSELTAANEAAKGNAARRSLEKAALDEHAIKSPFAGTVLEVEAERGGLARGEDALIVVADRSAMKVVIFLPLDLVADVEAASARGAITAYLAAPVDQDVPLTLQAIDPRIEPSSGTMRAVFHFDNVALGSPSGVEATVTVPDGA